MPRRDSSLLPTGGPHRARHALFRIAGLVVVLAIGIVISTRLVSRGSSRPAVTKAVAPPTNTAKMPGRHATIVDTHTRTGAVAAAARSITAFAGDVLLEPSRLRAIVARIAASSARARLVAAFEEASAQTRAKLGAGTVPRPVILLRAVPLGYRVVRYSPDAATVAVWYVGIVGSGATVQPQQSWRTQTVELVWEHGGWKVGAYTSMAGPTPALSAAEAEAPGELFALIPRFQEFAYGAR
jgi:hypothetical protein